MLYPEYKSSLIKKMPVIAMLLPRITDAKYTSITPCSTGEAMTALAPTTLFQLPALRQEAFVKMSIFSKSIESYHLNIGADSNQLPQILNNFIKDSISK